MFGRSSDDVLLLPRRIYGRSQNSARMKKTTFFCKSTFWVSTFLPLLSPKLRTHFGVRNQYQAKSAYARFIFEQVKEMFFAFCARKMDSFVSYFAGFLRKTNQTSQQLFRFLMNFEIFKHQRIMFLCDKNEHPKILVLKQKAMIFLNMI